MAARQWRVAPGIVAAARTTRVQLQACFPRRQQDAIVEEACVIELRRRYLSPSTGVEAAHSFGRRAADAAAQQSRIDLSHLSGQHCRARRFAVHGAVALMSFLPFGALNLDRFAAARALWALGAWLMAMSQVYLWAGPSSWPVARFCLTRAARTSVNSANGRRSVYAVERDRGRALQAIENSHEVHDPRFGLTTSSPLRRTVSTGRERVARLIAERAGVPLVRG